MTDEKPEYTPRVRRIQAACQHTLNLLDNPQPLHVWRDSVLQAIEETADACGRVPTDAELKEQVPED